MYVYMYVCSISVYMYHSTVCIYINIILYMDFLQYAFTLLILLLYAFALYVFVHLVCHVHLRTAP